MSNIFHGKSEFCINLLGFNLRVAEKCHDKLPSRCRLLLESPVAYRLEKNDKSILLASQKCFSHENVFSTNKHDFFVDFMTSSRRFIRFLMKCMEKQQAQKY